MFGSVTSMRAGSTPKRPSSGRIGSRGQLLLTVPPKKPLFVTGVCTGRTKSASATSDASMFPIDSARSSTIVACCCAAAVARPTRVRLM